MLEVLTGGAALSIRKLRTADVDSLAITLWSESNGTRSGGTVNMQVDNVDNNRINSSTPQDSRPNKFYCSHYEYVNIFENMSYQWQISNVKLSG